MLNERKITETNHDLAQCTYMVMHISRMHFLFSFYLRRENKWNEITTWNHIKAFSFSRSTLRIYTQHYFQCFFFCINSGSFSYSFSSSRHSFFFYNSFGCTQRTQTQTNIKMLNFVSRHFSKIYFTVTMWIMCTCTIYSICYKSSIFNEVLMLFSILWTWTICKSNWIECFIC